MAADIPPPPAQATLMQETQRKRMPAWAWAIIAAVTILIAVLAFVTAVYWLPNSSQPNPAPTTTSAADQPDPAPEPTVTELPVAAPIVLPDCETLWPERYARAVELANKWPESGIRYDNFGDNRFTEHFGPAAQTALSQTTQLHGCGYPSTFETYTHLYLAELSGSPKDAFLAALRADGDFTESVAGEATVFIWEQPLEGGHWNAAYTMHAFIGDVWIAGYGGDPAADYVPQIASAILAANPTLQ